MRIYITSILCTLVCSSVVHADGKEKTLYAAITPESARWQQTSTAMSASDYQRSVSNNQTIVQRELQTYSDRLLNSTGAYGPAIGLFGAAIAVAAKDARYDLNDSKTMGLVMRDFASGGRSVLIEYRKNW